MKRTSLVIAALAAFALTLCLAGCGAVASTPSKVITQTLDAFKAGNMQAAATNYTGSDLSGGDSPLGSLLGGDNAVDSAVESDSPEVEQASKEMSEAIVKKILDIDYKIVDESIDGDKATVTVEINSYDVATPFKDALTAFLKNAFSAAFAQAFGGSEVDSDKMSLEFFDDLGTRLKAQDSRTLNATVTFKLSKSGEGWKVDPMDDQVKFALTGGLSKLGTDLSNLSNSLQQ